MPRIYFLVMLLSQTEENYLKVIYKLSNDLSNSVSTNAIANHLDTKASSVTDMLKRLAEKSLLDYKKYQGVVLTDSGKEWAIKIIRKHRLWEVFLARHLNFNWDEIHEVAEQLEHIRSQKLVDELDAFLEYPTHDPHGDPIPDADGNITKQHYFSLQEMVENEKVIFTGVKDSSAEFLKYLDKIEFTLGICIEVLSQEPFDKSLKIKINNDTILYISERVSKNILVKKQSL